MPQQRAKGPLDVLQSMVNAVVSSSSQRPPKLAANLPKLLETGRALRAADKREGTQSSSDDRLRTTIPVVIETFQQALDDMEIDIVREEQYGKCDKLLILARCEQKLSCAETSRS